MEYRKWAVFVSVVVALAVGQVRRDAEAQVKASLDPFKLLRKSVALIRNPTRKTAGTTFVLKLGKKQFYITNWHVCRENPGDMMLVESPQGPIPLLIVKTSIPADLCAMAGPDNSNGIELGGLSPVMGDKLYSSGYPRGVFRESTGTVVGTDESAVSYGPPPNGKECAYGLITKYTSQFLRGERISASADCLLKTLMYDTSIPAAPGASGSPVVNEAGKLVAVVVGTTDESNAYTIPLFAISAFVESLR